MKKAPWLVPIVTVVTLLLASAAIAGHKEHEGWYLEVEGASATPGNVNTALIASSPADGGLCCSGGTSFENDIRFSDFDSDVAFRVGFGYSWGKKGRLQVTYWSYSDEESRSGFVDAYSYPPVAGVSNYNWFTVGPTNAWGYTQYYPMDFSFKQEIDASTLDIEYVRPVSFSNENLDVTWGIGFRWASFEDKTRGSYLVDPAGGAFSFPATREVEGDGLGFTGSVGVEYTFNDNILGISSNLRVGFITADVDSKQSITDVDGYYSPAGSRWSESQSMEDEVASTVDFDANIVFHTRGPVEFDVGWFYSTWSDLGQFSLGRATNFTDDQAGVVIPGENRDRVSWSGPRVRARIMF